MFGTRNSFHKVGALGALLPKEPGEKEAQAEYLQANYLKRLYQQAKQVSQIIAYIWRWADQNEKEYAEKKKVANQLKTYFEQPSKDGKRDDGYLKELFAANPTIGDPQYPDPAYLLKKVFTLDKVIDPNYIFPIFSSFELGTKSQGLGYSFEVTVSSFVGQILDADMNSPELFKMIIPYPPCPPLGKATLDKDTLDEWIKNRKQDEYFSKNPYIPTTCS